MKLFTHFLGIVFLFTGLLSEAQVSHQINLSINDFSTIQVGGYDVIKMKNTSPLYGVGDIANSI